MLQDNDVASARSAELLVGIYLEAVIVEGPHAIILILKVDGAVAVLERPKEGKTVLRAGTVFAESDGVIFLTAGDAGIECVEHAVVVGIESRLLIFPGRIGQQIEVGPGSALTGTAGRQKTGDKKGQYGQVRMHPAVAVGRPGASLEGPETLWFKTHGSNNYCVFSGLIKPGTTRN